MPTKSKPSSPTEIPLDEIVLDDLSLQMREGPSDGDQIENLRDAYQAGADVPPIILFAAEVSGTYYIGDGWHRCWAIKGIRGRKTIPAKVSQGGREAALRYACGANANHGLRRTNDDKRKAVTTAIREWPQLSGRAIAEICKVSADFANRMKKELSSDDSCDRVGKDGKTRKVPTKDKEPGEQVDFWNVFRSDLGEWLGSIERSRKNDFFGEKMMDEPDRAAEELETAADALADEAREMRSLAKQIRKGQSDNRKGGSV